MEKKTAIKQILPGIAAAVGLGFLLFIYAPFELYITNQIEFWFTAKQMLPYCALMFAVFVAAAGLVMLAAGRIHTKLYAAVAAMCVAFLLSAYIQGSFLVSNLPGMNGAAVDWKAYTSDRVVSAVLWIGVMAAVAVLWLKMSPERFVKTAALVSLALTLMLAITVGTLFLTTKQNEKSRGLVATDDELFTYSADENFVIVALDALDATAFEQSLSRDEHYPEIFEDFTYYSNATGGYPYSKCSIPLILTGRWYEAETDFIEFETQAMLNSPILQRTAQNGYEQYLYVTDPSLLRSVDAHTYPNLTTDQPVPASVWHMCKLLIKMTIIKHAPWDLKYLGYDLPGRLNEHIKYGGKGDHQYFDWSDLSFYQRLEDINPIETVSDKQFKYIHLEGAHEPHVYDKNLNVLESSPYRDVIEGNFTMMEAYLQRMKDAGVYDNSVIVILADHGSHNDTDLVNMNQHPILLIKGRNERHPMETDDAPVSYDDLQQAFLRLCEGKKSAEVFDWNEGDARERRFFSHELNSSSYLEEYVQTGHAEDMTTLVPTGKVFIYEK